jgi:hypothetical protein
MSCGKHYRIWIIYLPTLERVQMISRYKRLTLVRRLNKPGAWSLELDLDCTEVPYSMMTENYGIEVWRNGQYYFSGPIRRIERRNESDRNGPDTYDQDSGNRNVTLSGPDWLVLLQQRICLPDPWYPTTQFNMAYDSRSGAAERVMKNYVDLNCGPNAANGASAGAYRKYANFQIEPNQDRGSTVYYVARFDNLLTVCQNLIRYIPWYRFEIEKVDPGAGGSPYLQFRLRQTFKRWKSGTDPGGVEFSERMRNLVSSNYTFEQPDFNFVIVGGGRSSGNETNPLYRQFAYSGNEYSRARGWGTIESFVDKRGTTNTNELKQAAWDALRLEQGKEDPDKNMCGKITVSCQITEVDGGPQLGVDFDLGDYVRVVVHNNPTKGELIEVLDYIKEIQIDLTPEEGEKISATVGTDDYVQTGNGLVPYITDSILRIKERLQNLEGGGY